MNTTGADTTPADIADVERLSRLIAREEIASLCGLVLRRLQDEHPSRMMERNAMEDVFGTNRRDAA